MADEFQRVNPLILIADDDETERFLQRQVLEPAGRSSASPSASRISCCST